MRSEEQILEEVREALRWKGRNLIEEAARIPANAPENHLRLARQLSDWGADMIHTAAELPEFLRAWRESTRKEKEAPCDG